jgi:ABC-type antimicrobial peptide transport system permease subunit
MTWTILLRRSLAHHARIHAAVVLGAVAATAALAGALVVGDSMRASLRDTALRKLGPVDTALVARRFFRESLADEMKSLKPVAEVATTVCPVILVRGGVTSAKSGARVNQANIMGVDERFWSMAGRSETKREGVVVNAVLADELKVCSGDDLIIRLERPQAVPVETLLGRPADSVLSIRRTIDGVVAKSAIADFNLDRDTRAVRNVFVPLGELQRALKQPNRANAVLAVTHGDVSRRLNGALTRCAKLEDYSLHIRINRSLGYVSLESDNLLLEPPVESAAVEAAKAVGSQPVPILAYLVNSIEHGPARARADGRQTAPNAARELGGGIPYSIAVAVDPAALRGGEVTLRDGTRPGALGENEALLNQWAADDLRVRAGDEVTVSYYLSGEHGRLETHDATLKVRGVVPIKAWAADQGFTPNYEGITDARSLKDWNPPFPIDLRRIRDKDEKYWETQRTTPKMFVSPQTGLALWGKDQERFGKWTSIRVHPRMGASLDDLSRQFEAALLKRLTPGEMGLAFEDVRRSAIEASRGNTDFAMLFLGFSSFLIISSALLVGMFFRLGVERRAAELGLLRAVGIDGGRVLWFLLAEGLVLCALGASLGLPAAVGYAATMIHGLRTWWADAVGAPMLELHVLPSSMFVGAMVSIAVASMAIALSVRAIARLSPRKLLAGDATAAISYGPGNVFVVRTLFLSFMAISVVLATASFSSSTGAQAAFFFGSGSSLLISLLAGFSLWMSRGSRSSLVTAHGGGAIVRLGARNISRHRGRSLLTAGLVSAATFILVAVAANQRAVNEAVGPSTSSGTGGFALLADSGIPITFDMRTKAGRDSLNLSQDTCKLLDRGRVYPLRVRAGDDASCRNLYQARQPRIVGAPPAFVSRGGFTFSETMTQTTEEQANPWLLLNQSLEDGALAAIGDESTVRWMLHLGLGDDFTMTDDHGRQTSLRIVGMLAGSVLQGELIVAESDFTKHFSASQGYRRFLIEAPADKAEVLAQALERDLGDYLFDAESAAKSLAGYLAVENTYLAVFRSLGGLGLILGVVGLAAVMMRNVLERRGELALLRAVGFSPSALRMMVLSENASLLGVGLGCGFVAALVAVAPQFGHGGHIPWPSIIGTILAVIATGMLAAIVAVRATLNVPLVPALRRE